MAGPNSVPKLSLQKEHNMTKSRLPLIALWVLRILAAALFIFAGAMKLSSQPMMVASFDAVGLGQWFRYLTGSLELIGGLAVLVPRISVLGASLLLIVDIGAFVAQLTILHQDVIHTMVIAILLGLIIYLQRDKLSLRTPQISKG